MLDLRDILSESLLEAEPDKRAPLAAQLRLTVAEIEELEARDVTDQFAETPVEAIRRERIERRAS